MVKKEAVYGLCTGLCCCRAGRAVSAAVTCQATVCCRGLSGLGLSGSCQAVTLGLTATEHLACQTLLSGCQIRAVRLSEKVLSALSGCRALSGAVRDRAAGGARAPSHSWPHVRHECKRNRADPSLCIR